MKSILSLFLLLLSSVLLQAGERPNIVWLVSEDNSMHFLRLFAEGGAAAPNIERLAEKGLVFEKAFSNASVCSVARTTLMSGIYAPRIGAQHHRALHAVDLPDRIRFFPALLREAGYHTTNNNKKDFNIKEDHMVFDESSNQADWRSRPEADTPFFHMQTFMVTHESRLHFERSAMNPDTLTTAPDEVPLFPYFPATAEFRYTHARYLELMGRMDEEIGKVLESLAKDGLLENTFIFYFGDHGGVLPRSKGYLYETGLHVPLVVRIPDNWVDSVNFDRGDRINGFVSFIDFAPTVLRLAGVEQPEWLDGKAFLGEGVAPAEVAARDETFGYADRMDAKYDFVRSLRKGHYKYIRNYFPFYPDSLNNNYRYKMIAYRQWRNLYRNGELGSVERMFFEPKPAEALYDLRNDPFEIRNLREDPEYAPVLAHFRATLQEKVRSLPDLSFFPESVLLAEAVNRPLAFAAERGAEIGRLADVADLIWLPFAEAHPKIQAALEDASPYVRYWGLIACSAFGVKAHPLVEHARPFLDDPDPLIRMRAAEFLGKIGEADPLPHLRKALLEADSAATAGLILNSVIFLGDSFSHIEPGTDWDIVPEPVQSPNTHRQVAYLIGEGGPSAAYLTTPRDLP